MKKLLINCGVLTITLIIGLIYGVLIYKIEIFPYGIIKATYRYLTPIEEIDDDYGPWSIGIYEGYSPFDLSAAKDVSNPVLTGKDIDDIDAVFVADPFMAFKNGKYYMYFEVLNRESDHGDIGYATSLDGKKWEYKNIIIDEAFHLSYPHVFQWGDDDYLIPESAQDLSVRLYKAISFPDKWEYVDTLLSGYRYIDPSIFRYNDIWWMFVTTSDSDVLNLYYSNNLLGKWEPHSMNPIVKFDKNIARSGGRVIIHNNRPYRLTQDDYPSYGIQVFAFEITELTEKSYVEKIVSDKPLVNKTGIGWNATGMHHIDLHKIGDKWMGVVDGKNR